MHQVSVDGSGGRASVTAAEFRRFGRETGHVTVAERPPDPEHYPTPTLTCSFPARRLSQAGGPVNLDDYRKLVGVRAGRVLEAAGRQGHDDQRA